MTVACVLLLVLAAGYVTQRGNVCAVAAVAELVEQGRAHQFAGFLLCSACSLLAISMGELLGCDVIARQVGRPATLVAALGGAVYGAGAFVNGRCAFGTVARLGRGELSRLATVAGFAVGAALAPVLLAQSPPIASPLLLLEHGTRAVIAWTLVAMLVRWLAGSARTASYWSPVRAMVALGSLIGLLTVWGQDWAYTPLLLDGASGVITHPLRHAALAVVFVGGSCLGAVAVGLFQPRREALLQWARAAAGGSIMGAGARLVPGGNDAMVFVGLPLLLPNMVLAYCAMNAALFTLTIGRTAIRRHAEHDKSSGRLRRAPWSPVVAPEVRLKP